MLPLMALNLRLPFLYKKPHPDLCFSLSPSTPFPLYPFPPLPLSPSTPFPLYPFPPFPLPISPFPARPVLAAESRRAAR